MEFSLPNCLRALLVCIALVPITRLAHAQQQEPSAAPVTPPPNEGLRGMMVLRISDELLKRLLARDIDSSTQVDRCVLGTRSRGTARTTGKADVMPKRDHDDAAFRVVIAGQTNSRTIGRNGPAIIHTNTNTQWEVNKVVRFEGGDFVTSPGTIDSQTRITPLCVDSTKAGLRGRLVRKVATKRVYESKRTAESITGNKTRDRVLKQVDESVDQRIAALNRRIQSRPFLDYFLTLLESPAVKLSTSNNCIHVAFLGVDQVAGLCPLDQLEPSETELWIHLSLIDLPELDTPDVPLLGENWAEKLFPKIELADMNLFDIDFPELELGALGPIQAKRVDDWIVLRSGLSD